MSKKIFANNDQTKYAIVDDDIAEIIKEMSLKFCIDKYGYFRSTTKIQLPCMNKKKCLYLHQFVYIIKTGEEPMSSLDHKDINPLNNQFSNLRLATRREQQHNKCKRNDNKSGFIGVSFCHYKRGNGYYYWRACIQRPGGKNEVKLFPYTDIGLIAAAHWHDSKAREYFGEFCGELNFPSHDNKTGK